MQRRVGLIAFIFAIHLGIIGRGSSQEPATTPAVGAKTLEERVGALLASPGFESAHWGLLFVDAKTGDSLFERNADQLFSPASVTKLFSGATALDSLGADFRFQTPIVRHGEVDASGVLHGDLILVASGDLAMGGRTSPEDGALLFRNHDHTYAGGDLLGELVPVDPLAGLDHLAREVQAAGIKEVDGEVIVDDRLFEPAESTGSGPSRISPILVNDNLVDVLVSPAAKVGEKATIKTLPVSSFYAVDARVETVEAGIEPEIKVESVGPRRFIVRGKLPLGHREVLKVYEVDEPAAYARALLLERLSARGVQVSASALGANPTEKLPPRDKVAELPKVAQYTSPALKEYLRVILKVSHNLHASTLPLLIALKHGDRTLDAGLKREGAFLKELGIDLEDVSFGSGAGGSRADLVTPRATVALLKAMAGRPDSVAFEAALPILGRDGTAAEHVPADSPVRGHVRAKTGTYWVDNPLNGESVLTSKALAGYMETASGRPLIFSVFVNGVPADGEKVSSLIAGKLLGSICEAVYLSDGPTAATADAAAPAGPP
jgi:serine-type D-Ala-D-Ala carboxypeptidase/endopeptidase (penicillin-binding protein 4)